MEPVDVIVYATGFNITLPFIDRSLLNWSDGKPELFLNVFHPKDDTLCVAGLIQPDSGQFGLVDHQARLIAHFWQALDNGAATAERFRRNKAKLRWEAGAGIHYLHSPRHLLEVEHYSYRRQLERQLEQCFLASSPV